MSRLRRERVERLIRSFQPEPDVKVFPAPWVLEVLLGRPPTKEELTLSVDELMAKYPPAWKAPR